MSHTILPKNQRNLGGFDLKSPQLQQSPSGPFGKIQVASNSTEQHPQRFQTHMHSPAGMRQASMENISSRHNTRLQRIVRALKNIKSAFHVNKLSNNWVY